MAITNHERVGKALELLKIGLGPFVDREIKAAIAANSLSMQKVKSFVDDPMLANKGIVEWDAAALLKLMWETWNEVFRKTLGFADRSLVSEIRDWRNKWAHQDPFSSDDADRALDSMARVELLSLIEQQHGRRVAPEARATIFTVRQLVDAVLVATPTAGAARDASAAQAPD